MSEKYIGIILLANRHKPCSPFLNTMPMTYHYAELMGKIDGFFLKLEPEVDSVWFGKW